MSRALTVLLLTLAMLLVPAPSLGQTSRRMSSSEKAVWIKLFSDMKDDSEDGSDCREVAETALAALVLSTHPRWFAIQRRCLGLVVGLPLCER